MKRVLITGSSGLVGSEAVSYYDQRGWQITGVDNNGRADFFGAAGSTANNLDRLKATTTNFTHNAIDIRDRHAVHWIVEQFKPDLVIHAAAQPSHDLAAKRPLDDFDVNAVGTINMLEAGRQSCDPVFVFISTNKVYGDAPNEIPLVELETRFDFADRSAIAEDMRIDHCLHSIFGASKVAADVMVQEYGRYFGMKTCVFRCGCITGGNHAGVQLHGFLNYLFKVAKTGGEYQIIGHKGKQVRDNIHAFDLITAIDAFASDPKTGAVYNMGGGRQNSCSVIEAILAAEERTKRMITTYVDQPRKGDHICYITDLSKFTADFPNWTITRSLASISDELSQ